MDERVFLWFWQGSGIADGHTQTFIDSVASSDQSHCDSIQPRCKAPGDIFGKHTLHLHCLNRYLQVENYIRITGLTTSLRGQSTQPFVAYFYLLRH